MTDKEFRETILKLQETDTQDYTGYYSGYHVLLMNDLDNNIPEIYLISGNRTAGKTFFFKRLVTRFAIMTGGKFMFQVRKRTQLTSAGQSFIEDIQNCPDFTETFTLELSELTGVREIYYGGKCIGYITYLNYADDIKEASNMFNKVEIIFKDEFQLANPSGYCEDEIGKFRSIHKSVARSFGHSTRFVPCILVSNQISIINPYFLAFGITKRLGSKTRKLRGRGWVFTLIFNKEASSRAKESAFEKAFGGDAQSLSDNENIFMDDLSMIEKQDTSKMRTRIIFSENSVCYGLWEGGEYIYISKKYDPSCRLKYAVDLKSVRDGFMIMSHGNPILLKLHQYFEKGLIKFEDIECKHAMIDIFSRSLLKK